VSPIDRARRALVDLLLVLKENPEVAVPLAEELACIPSMVEAAIKIAMLNKEMQRPPVVTGPRHFDF
jgi:hypothetical protein